MHARPILRGRAKLATLALRALAVSAFVFASGCAHDVTIKSNPPGAKVFIDGEERGETPLSFEEENGFFEQREVRVELEDYQTIETTIVQSEPVWACAAPSVCLGPFTFCISCLGLRYATKYAEEYEIVLDPIRKDGSDPARPPEEEEPLDPEMTIPY